MPSSPTSFLSSAGRFRFGRPSLRTPAEEGSPGDGTIHQLGFSEIAIEAQPRPTFGPPRPPSFVPDNSIQLPKAPTWRASEVLVANPVAIDNPLTVAGAAAEMKTFNATWHAPSDPDSAIPECRAAMSNIFAACNAMAPNELAPIVVETATALALRPDFAKLASGAFERVRNLIQSNYSKSPRRSIKTATRSWACHTTRLLDGGV